MLWLESVIGTALWCWWQVPARRYERRVGALRTGLALRSALVACLFLCYQSFHKTSIRDTTQEKGPASNGQGRADPGAPTAGPACGFGCLDCASRCSVVPS